MNTLLRGAIVYFVAVVIAIGALCSADAFAEDIYIPDDNPTIQEGIDAAASGDKVIVRDGTYLLTAALDFKGKAITVKSENGPENCILDGQQQTRVVYFHSGETSKSVLSGFVIRYGQADKGAGILCDSSSPTISNCTIMANKAYKFAAADTYSYGGGIYCNGASPIITNCVISGNSSEAYTDQSWYYTGTSYGGGIYCKGGSPTITNCTVSGNMALAIGHYVAHAYGGGIYSDASSPIIANCDFSNNSLTAANNSQGGGMFFTASFPSLVNTVINSNSSKLGAGIYFSLTPGSLTNCTIVRNTASEDGGGLYCDKSSPTIVNSILWQDYAQVAFNEISKDATSSPTVTYSDVLGGYDGAGNIDANPVFKNIGTGDFHLDTTSPCIDTGNNGAPELPAKDKDNKPRIVNGIVDMGAYEFQKPPVISSFTANPTSGPPPLAVTFKCKATVPGGKIAKYQWDFGDGSSTETQTGTAEHTYSSSPPDDNETFLATVKVIDNHNLSTTSQEIEIRPFNGPDLAGKVTKYGFTAASKTINVKIRVTNSGNVAAGPFKVTFHLSNNGSTPLAAFKEIPVDGLAAGKGILLTVDNIFTKFIYGQYILIYVDPDNEVKEIDDTNNGTNIVIQPMATE